VCIVRFPFGAMERQILEVGRAHIHGDPGWQPVAIREGITETSQYWQKRWLGQLLYTRLFTNNHPMSCTANQARRYMNYFVYWPVAVHPNPRSALLICYGVGSTAKALTDTKRLQSIDVVDISSDILANSTIIFPNEKENPLYDPRVSVHAEDGRFFLQTTQRRFDIITAEPPPPLAAGVVNLYSQEYFQLIYDRLQEGGVVTYWLPSWQIPWSATQSIVKAFCNVFQDCSLWTGTAFDWMLVGTRGTAKSVSEKHFQEQWQDPVVGPQLRLYGFEQPEQIGATFIMDAPSLREWTKDSLPVVDNYPKRIFGTSSDVYEYTLADLEEVMNADRCHDRFQRSPFVARLWPESLRKKSLAYFHIQACINNGFVHPAWADPVQNIQSLHDILTLTSLRFPVMLMMGGPEFPDRNRVLGEVGALAAGDHAGTLFSLGVRAIADRDYVTAEKYFAQEQRKGHLPYVAYYRVYALCLADRVEEARQVVRDSKDVFAGPGALDYEVWLTKTFGF
jgi:spermidine synthase